MKAKHNFYQNNESRIVNLSPPSLLALGFLCFIVIGTLLLKLPFAHRGDLSWMHALFTSTSAVTITGLSVVHVGETYTVFGKVIIMLLLQCGGLGFMTFAILAALSLSNKMGLKQQVMAQEVIGQTSLNRVSFTIKGVLLYSLFFEAIGTTVAGGPNGSMYISTRSAPSVVPQTNMGHIGLPSTRNDDLIRFNSSIEGSTKPGISVHGSCAVTNLLKK